MADLSSLVEGLGLTDSPSERRYRQRPEYGNQVENFKAPGAQGTTQGWNARSHIQKMELEALDPTSQVVPYPPFDLDSKLAQSFQSPGTVPEHLLKRLGFFPDRPSSKVVADHDQLQAPTPDPAIQEDDDTESWITTSLDSVQNRCEHSVPPVRARTKGCNDRQIRRAYGHSLLGSSIADISDDSSVPSFKTKDSLVPSQLFSRPGPVYTPPPIQKLKTPRAKPQSAVISQRPKGLTFELPEQEAAGIFQHSKLEQRHHTPSAGSILPFQTTQGPECHSIAPIPLDYIKTRPPKTPSIATERSNLKFPSLKPVIAEWESKQHQHQKQNKRLTERNLHKVSKPTSHDTLAESRVEIWLKDAEAEVNEDIKDVVDLEVEDGFFAIWSKDAEREAIDYPNPPNSGERPQRSPTRARALQDVINLRQPGYLQKNSFFQDAKKN